MGNCNCNCWFLLRYSRSCTVRSADVLRRLATLYPGPRSIEATTRFKPVQDQWSPEQYPSRGRRSAVQCYCYLLLLISLLPLLCSINTIDTNQNPGLEMGGAEDISSSQWPLLQNDGPVRPVPCFPLCLPGNWLLVLPGCVSETLRLFSLAPPMHAFLARTRGLYHRNILVANPAAPFAL